MSWMRRSLVLIGLFNGNCFYWLECVLLNEYLSICLYTGVVYRFVHISVVYTLEIDDHEWEA